MLSLSGATKYDVSRFNVITFKVQLDFLKILFNLVAIWPLYVVYAIYDKLLLLG